MAESRPLPRDKIAVTIAFVLALAAIVGAWGSELFGGLIPCELCLEQRWAYYLALPVLAIVLLFWNRLPLLLWYGLIAVAIAAFAWGTFMAVYHAGVEWAFWPGPTSCTGGAAAGGPALTLDSLSNINQGRVVPCDAVQFRFLGISLAGYNALVSAAVVVLLLLALGFQLTRRR